MKYRELSNTGLTLSSLTLGTMNFGQQNTEADAHVQLDYAVSQGINFIDTAEVYPIPPDRSLQGLTEEYVGSWIEKRKKREDIYIATKVVSRNQSSSVRLRDASMGLTKKSIQEAIDGSLLRLKTDYVDLYQVHTPDRQANIFGVRGVEELNGDDGASIEETLDGLKAVIDSGKVRYIGVSNETPWGIGQYLKYASKNKHPRIVSIQNQYSLLNRTFEIGLSEICLRENIALLPYSVLNMGVLSGKYIDDAKPAGARFTIYERNRARYNPPHAQSALKRYVTLAQNNGMTPSQLAIAFAQSRADLPMSQQ